MSSNKKSPSVKELMDALIDEIVKVRTTKGWSTYDMETKTGIRQSNITRLETKKAKPNLETMLKITTALGIELKLVY